MHKIPTANLKHAALNFKAAIAYLGASMFIGGAEMTRILSDSYGTLVRHPGGWKGGNCPK